MDKIILKDTINSIKEGDIEKFKILINENPELINIETPFGTWLHIAAKSGCIEIVKFLVNEGVDINKKGGTFDASALNLAALGGNIEAVKYLVEKGSIIDTSLAKRNPLFSAIQVGNMDIVQYFVEKGIDINIKYNTDNLDNIDAYEFARQFGQTEIAEYLKSKLEEK